MRGSVECIGATVIRKNTPNPRPVLASKQGKYQHTQKASGCPPFFGLKIRPELKDYL
jgi:hypothetical protein